VTACARLTGPPPALVLAGGAGWDRELDAAVAAVPSGLRLLRPGYLPLADLPGLLGAAAVVAYPSLGEGFGLPVLEAMACGAAVLTTRRLALPEVGGDAVAYTEPDAASIADALGRLLSDPELREHLSRAGVARAQRFSWAACAEAHLHGYEQALRRSRQAGRL
jgi:glycosyltransferase involved in cell wall biosynthesis